MRRCTWLRSFGLLRLGFQEDWVSFHEPDLEAGIALLSGGGSLSTPPKRAGLLSLTAKRSPHAGSSGRARGHGPRACVGAEAPHTPRFLRGLTPANSETTEL